MTIYHYTTIDSLAMIMNSRSIKFNRLDKVDDIEERVESKNVRLWQYMFVSCWTESSEESIPLWRMYSGNSHGVRIGMDVDMFEDYLVDKNVVPQGIPCEGRWVGKIPAKDLFRNDYFIIPSTVIQREDGGDTLFYCHVDYVDDVEEKTKNVYQTTIPDDKPVFSTISFGEVGKYKNKRWAFQEESRFRLVILPINLNQRDPYIVSNAIDNSVPVPISEYYMKLRQEALNNINITLHPNATVSDRVIVEGLCEKYARNASIKPSELTNRVMLK